MSAPLIALSLNEWDARYAELRAAGLKEPAYGGPLSRHLDEGDLRLAKLRFDPSPAALRLWNFLLTEEERLAQARASGKKIVGTMKDLGTVPVMAYALPNLTAFYPDGAWWIPCVMEHSAGVYRAADALGVDESFCPVRAMLGAFATKAHFPLPDLLVCSVGATCDDFSAIAQRLNGLGHPVFWWEIPHRRAPVHGETAVRLPTGFAAPSEQVAFVRGELERVCHALEELAGEALGRERLAEGIRVANEARNRLNELRRLVYRTDPGTPCPLPALEMLIAEMLIIHFCSDREETLAVYADLLNEVRTRREAGIGMAADAVRVFWVNPVADLRAMNILEDCGGRLCGTEYLFCHALDAIPEDIEPMDALARTALADPMVGPSRDRADRICRDAELGRAEALIVSRIPGASHCPYEAGAIRAAVERRLGIPVLEMEIPPVSDAFQPALRTRIEALIETVRNRRG